jgi:hypothetical protein
MPSASVSGTWFALGAAALRRRQGKSHSKLANCSRRSKAGSLGGFDTLDLKKAKALPD